jgi:hypothetical protein
MVIEETSIYNGNNKNKFDFNSELCKHSAAWAMPQAQQKLNIEV